MIREQALKFAFALFMVTIATYLRIEMEPTIQSRVPFGTYTLAVILVAWIGGVWPAVLALVASTLCAAHFIIPPERSLTIADPADQVATGIFFTVGIVSILLFGRIEWQRKLALQNAEENLQLNAELRKLDKQKDAFLSLLAHELRSPLAPIGNAIAIIEKCDCQPSDIRATTRKLSKNFRHLVCLINDLLDVSRYLRDAIQLRREHTDLAECISTAVEMISDEMHAKHHRLTIDTPEHAVVVFADQVRVCQIMCNLLSNAVRYTPECGEIHVSLAVHSSHIEFSVRDTGLGIPANIKDDIFTPFFQANSKQSRFAPGLGLGLSIVKKLVALHGGEIEVVSQGANTGSTFSIRLPTEMLMSSDTSLAHVAQQISPPINEPANEPESEPGPEHQATQSKLRVLIADDDCDTADTFSQLLRYEGFETEIAVSGLAAVQKCAKFRPHVLLLDIGLPGLDGFEVAQKVRAELGGQNVRIIAVSGWGAESDKRKGIEAGFDEHFLKPVKLDEILPLLTEKSVAKCS